MTFWKLIAAAFVCLAWTGAAFAEPEPEFDGVYLLSKDGKFVELTVSNTWRSTVVDDARMPGDQVQGVWYITDKSKRGRMQASSLSAIAVRGKYAGARLTLHNLTSATLGPKAYVPNETTPLLKRGKPYYIATGNIELRTKASGQTRYYVPKQQPAPGEYIVNLGGGFWVVEFE